MGSRSHMGKGSFGGCSGHWKALGFRAAMYAAKGITQFSVTTWQQCCDWFGSHHVGPHEKSAPPVMLPSVKILWPRVCRWFRIFVVHSWKVLPRLSWWLAFCIVSTCYQVCFYCCLCLCVALQYLCGIFLPFRECVENLREIADSQ